MTMGLDNDGAPGVGYARARSTVFNMLHTGATVFPMPNKTEYAPMSLSARTVARVELTLKVLPGAEPLPTIYALANTLIEIHRLRRTIAIARRYLDAAPGVVLDTAETFPAPTSRIALRRSLPTNREGESWVEAGVPDLRTLDKVIESKDPLPLHVNATPESLAELYEELGDMCGSAVYFGDRLDEIVRDQLPSLEDHPEWKVKTDGSGTGNNWHMHSQLERSFPMEHAVYFAKS
jgi:hypothetical protein